MLGLIAAGPLAALAWWLCPLEFTAVESLRIAQNQNSILLDSGEKIGAADFKGFKNTQRQLVLQPYSLNKSLKNENVVKIPFVNQMTDPIGWLQKEIEVTFPDQSEIMNVSLKSTDPVAAYSIVRAVVDTYMQDFVEKEKGERLERISALEKVLKETEERVRRRRNELRGLVDTLEMSDKSTVDLSQQLTLQEAGQVRQQLAQTKFDLMGLQNELQIRKKFKNGTVESVNSTITPDEKPSVTLANAEEKLPPASDTENDEISGSTPKDNHNSSISSSSPNESEDPRLEELIEADQVAAKLVREVERLQKLIEHAPTRYDSAKAAEFVAKYQPKLEETQQKLAERKERLRLRLPTNTSGINEAEFIATKIGILQEQQKLLGREMDDLMRQSKKFGQSSIDVEMLRKEIDALEPMVSQINQKIERTKIELQSTSRITRLQSNGVPAFGSSKLRIPLTAAAGLLGLLGPLLLLVLRDFLRNHVNSVATICNSTQISVLGSIPRVPTKVLKNLNDTRRKSSSQWRQRISESVAGVTAMLLRKLAVEGHRVVMITSATASEGKSTLAELLARSLADAGHKTLLVDFDLRRPALHRRFNLPLDPGVTDVLRLGADLKETACQTHSPNLSVLTAGNCEGSLLLESANGMLENLIKECRAEYELVVIDSSPLLPVVDGRLVGQFTDGVIMSVIKDTSQVSQVLAARSILSDFGIAVLGCVVTGDNSGAYYNKYGAQDQITSAVSRGIASSRSISAM